jgi:hypothetical protein
VDPVVGAALAVLNALVLLGVLAVEARLTAAAEHKLAAGASGLAVVAAISLLLLLTLLGGHLLRRLRRAEPEPSVTERPPTPGSGGPGSPEASLEAKGAGRRP